MPAARDHHTDTGCRLQLTYSTILLPLLVSFAILVAMLVLAWRSRRAPAATPFAYAIAALMVWTVGFAMELASTGVEAKLFWVNVQYVGIVALPVFWLQVVVTHLGYSRPRWWTLLWVVPALTLLFVWWAPGDVFYGDPSLISRGVPVPMLDYRGKKPLDEPE